jgi:hypothetical protein
VCGSLPVAVSCTVMVTSRMGADGKAAMGGSAGRQGESWDRASRDGAYLMERHHQPLWQAMLDVWDVRPGSPFVDAGCGGGGASDRIPERTTRRPIRMAHCTPPGGRTLQSGTWSLGRPTTTVPCWPTRHVQLQHSWSTAAVAAAPLKGCTMVSTSVSPGAPPPAPRRGPRPHGRPRRHGNADPARLSWRLP